MRSRPCSCVSVAACIVLAGPLALADGPPVFPTAVELVTVDAVVVDADERPVASLGPEDFTVLEQGVAQQIASFEAIRVPPPRDPASAGTPGQPSRHTHIATNAPAARGAMFLVVFDDLHLTPHAAKQARHVLARFLSESVNEGDRVTILVTGSGAVWSGTLAGDRDGLVAFASRLHGRSVSDDAEQMSEYEAMRIAEYNDLQQLDSVMGRYYRNSECSTLGPCDARVVGDARAVHAARQARREQTLAVLERALDSLAHQRGRKTVILLSEGFPHDDPRERGYSRVAGAAHRANAVVYFVDARGLSALPQAASAQSPRDGEPTKPRLPNTTVGAFQLRARDIKDLYQRSANERSRREIKVGIETIAGDTGGFVVRNTNDVAGGLERIASESRSYYLLGYYPRNAARDGRFRQIEVRVNRSGLRVRARKGYTATAPPGAGPRGDAEPVGLAFETPGELPLRLASYALEPTRGGKTRVVTVTEVDVAGVGPIARSGRRVGRLELRLEAVPRDGARALVRDLGLEVELPATAAPAGVWRAIRQELELPSGAYRVRAALRDDASGKAGSVGQGLLVPDPSSFHISTPILSDGTIGPGASEPIEAAAIAHQVFAAAPGRQLLCQFEVIGAAKDPVQRRADVTVRLTLTDRLGRMVAEAAPTAVAADVDGRLRQLIALPLGQLASGEYELALEVEDRIGGMREGWRDTFEVQTGPPVAD